MYLWPQYPMTTFSFRRNKTWNDRNQFTERSKRKNWKSYEEPERYVENVTMDEQEWRKKNIWVCIGENDSYKIFSSKIDGRIKMYWNFLS